MATLRFANRTGQTGVYHTGTPNYVACSGGVAETGYVTFETKETDNSWVDGDIVGILVLKDTSNYKVWISSWDATNKYLEAVTEEEAVGTISDSETVTVRAVLTEKQVSLLSNEPQINSQAGTTYELTTDDVGKTVCFTSATAVAVTISDALPVNFHCILVQEGAGAVTADSEGTDTLNGIVTGTGVAVSAQFQSLYIYQRVEGAWVAVGG